jgi:hypothetical protein
MLPLLLTLLAVAVSRMPVKNDCYFMLPLLLTLLAVGSMPVKK